MSPLDLPGKPFLGQLIDPRNTYCHYCGGPTRTYRLRQTPAEERSQKVRLVCPYCQKNLRTVSLSKVNVTEYR